LLLKTINSTELKILISKLKDYYSYIQTNKDTLIAKILGIFTFEVKKTNKINFSGLMKKDQSI